MNGASKKKPGLGLIVALISICVLIVGAVVLALVQSRSQWKTPPEVKGQANPVLATADSLAAGKQIFSEDCAKCHGNQGDGRGPRAERLSVAPTDFTDAHAMSQLTDGDLFWRIGAGRRPMPSFKNRLNDEQRWTLVDYIRTFAARN